MHSAGTQVFWRFGCCLVGWSIKSIRADRARIWTRLVCERLVGLGSFGFLRKERESDW